MSDVPQRVVSRRALPFVVLLILATATAGASNLSDVAAPSDQSCPEAPRKGERSIEETPAAGPTESETAAALRACHPVDGAAILASPRAPMPGQPLRLLAVAEQAIDAALVVLDPAGNRIGVAAERHGGPPFWWSIALTAHSPGTYRARLESAQDVVACEDVAVGVAPPHDRNASAAAWPVTRNWNRAMENLFAAWVERLFDAPLNEQPSWRSLHEVTRQSERNLLHDHLGLGEDDADGLRLVPDCADLPYFLRAYFAWKLGLPFGFSEYMV